VINKPFLDIENSSAASPERIKIQLQKICESQELKSKRVLCRLLNYITKETLEGRENQIKGYTIGLAVFNKDSDFDADHDALVRINAGRLRRGLSNYYSQEGLNDAIIIEIPKGSYAAKFSLNNTQTTQTIPTKRKHPVLVPSIAILPFKDLSQDLSNAYFTVGFIEELSVELTKYEDFHIYDCSVDDSNLFAHKNIPDFLEEKNIRFTLDGAISIHKSEVKVLVKLTDIIGQEQIWAQRFVKQLQVESVAEIQEQIAKEICSVLSGEYGFITQKLSIDSRHTKPKDIETYYAILKFYHYQLYLSDETALAAYNALNLAIKNEPDSGIVYGCLADLHANAYMLDSPDSEQSYRLFGELIEKAYQLDSNSILVNVILAFKYFIYNERDHFFNQVEKCLKSNPSGSLRLGALGLYIALYGEWERGKAILDDVINNNFSYALYLHGATALYYYRKKDYKQALSEANKYTVRELFWGPMLRVAAMGQLNRIGDTANDIVHLKQLKPNFEGEASLLISRFIKEEDLVAHVMDGLQKAGMGV